MVTLNHLKESHHKLKNSLLDKLYYLKLKNKQEKDSWERVIEAIQGIIYHHKIDPEEFKKHFKNLIDEGKFLNENESTFLGFDLIYCGDMQKMLSELKQNANEASRDIFYEEEKLEKYNEVYVAGLEEKYQDYTEKTPGFLEGVALRRDDHFKRQELIIAKRKAEQEKNTNETISKIISENPANIQGLPKDLLIYILSLAIENTASLGNFSLTCRLFNFLTQSSTMWKIALKNKLGEGERLQKEIEDLDKSSVTDSKKTTRLIDLNDKKESFKYFQKIFSNNFKKGIDGINEKPGKNVFKDTYRQLIAEAKKSEDLDILLKKQPCAHYFNVGLSFKK